MRYALILATTLCAAVMCNAGSVNQRTRKRDRIYYYYRIHFHNQRRLAIGGFLFHSKLDLISFFLFDFLDWFFLCVVATCEANDLTLIPILAQQDLIKLFRSFALKIWLKNISAKPVCHFKGHRVPSLHYYKEITRIRDFVSIYFTMFEFLGFSTTWMPPISERPYSVEESPGKFSRWSDFVVRIAGFVIKFRESETSSVDVR